MAIVVGGVSVDLEANAARIVDEMSRAGRAVDHAARGMQRDLSGFARGFDVAERKAVSFGSKITRALSGFAKGFGLGALGAGISVAGLGVLAKQALETADNIAKVADRTGVSTAALQALQFQASQTGASQEALNKSLEAFARRVGEAQAGGGPLVTTLARLDAEALANIQSSRNQGEALNAVADAIGNAKSEAQALAIAQAAFSETGRALALSFRDGAAGIAAFASKARDLGLIIDESLLRNAEKARDALDILQRVIGTRLTSALLQAAPLIQQLAEGFANAIPKIAAAGVEFARFLGLIERTKTEQLQAQIDALDRQINLLTLSLQVQRRALTEAANAWTDLFNVVPGMEGKFADTSAEIARLQEQLKGLKEQLKSTAAETIAAPEIAPPKLPEFPAIEAPPKAEIRVEPKIIGPALPKPPVFGPVAPGTPDAAVFEEMARGRELAVSRAADLAEQEAKVSAELDRQQRIAAGSALPDGIDAANIAASSLASTLTDVNNLTFQGLLQSFADMAQQIAQMVIQALIFRAIMASITGGGSAAVAAGPIPLFPGLQSGGPVTGGRSYLVGESGPEIFSPGTSGRIIPNNAIRSGGGGDTFNIDARNATPGTIAQAMNAAAAVASSVAAPRSVSKPAW